MTVAHQEQDKLIGAKRLREILDNCSDMHLWRQEHNPHNDFPDPMRINRRRYWYLHEIREWLASKRKAA